MSTASSRPSPNGNSSTNSSVPNDNGHSVPEKQLHCIADVSRQQGITLRPVARRWKCEIADIRDLEDGTKDLKLSQLYAWQKLLEVPVHELLLDNEMPLSMPVLRRAQMLRLMKTAVTLSDKSSNPEIRLLVNRLMGQLVEIMPELKNVGPWHENEERTDNRVKQVYRLPENT